MEDYLAEAAKAQGRYVTDENHPERGLFYRADHFSFAKRGVPVLLDMALAGAYDMVDGGRPAGEKWLSSFTADLLSPDLRCLVAELEPARARRRRRSCSTRSATASRTAATGRNGTRRRNSRRSGAERCRSGAAVQPEPERGR